MKTRIYAVTDAKGFVRVSIAAALDVAQYMRHGRAVEFASERLPLAGDQE